MSDSPERIAKFLSRCGVCSRRDAERLIDEKRVKVNGEIIDTPATKVTSTDQILVDNKKVTAPQKTRLWLYHKPIKVLTTHKDPEGRKTVFDALPKDMPRVISIGRLDMYSEGLLLLTNDGELSRILEHPSSAFQRTYHVLIQGEVTQDMLAPLKKRLTIEGMTYQPIQTKIIRTDARGTWVEFRLKEGKNREIRRIVEYLDKIILRLKRISYGPFSLKDLKLGDVKEAPEKDVQDLLQKVKK